MRPDLSAIQNLLRANDLPVADISKALIAGFLVAENASGSVIGLGGLEQLGSSVLLRSLGPSVPEARGIGVRTCTGSTPRRQRTLLRANRMFGY